MSKQVQFTPDSESQQVEIANGNYRRVFNRAEQPFDLTTEEWRVARRSQDLELVPEKLAAKLTDGQQSGDNGQGGKTPDEEQAGDAGAGTEGAGSAGE